MNTVINVVLLLLLFLDIIRLDSYIKRFDKARRITKYKKDGRYKLHVDYGVLLDFSLLVIAAVFGFIYFVVG